MKTLLAFVLALSFSTLVASNSIIAIVNDTVVTMDSISADINEKTTAAKKMALVQRQIDIVLQTEQIQALGIAPKADAVNQLLTEVAKQNGLTMAQLRSNNQFEEIINAIAQNLVLSELKQVVLQQANLAINQAEIEEVLANNPKKTSVTKAAHLANIKAQLFRAKKTAFFQGWVKSLHKNAYIEIFTDKLK
ncbi:Survival protein SurA precursor (Peptidyl-prolyl cis-trans isomerase SurA) [hydrothermal vent metagenome]|uniref:Survival protein SurA (Peptidyl-prolyl cis-trans isomerase SurA) n=1 Tax=hydrothermal vent metagenome TaxID=652676 RepID=A0A1W1E360_9ZZZZ